MSEEKRELVSIKRSSDNRGETVIEKESINAGA